jgi:tellurite methyltransferase
LRSTIKFAQESTRKTQHAFGFSVIFIERKLAVDGIMTAQDRVRWDNIYKQKRLTPYPPPDPLLFEYALPLALYPDPEAERRGLDLASGIGQNGLWLASQGYIVDLMDVSRQALIRARTEMTNRRLRNVNLLQVDLDTINLTVDHYDCVCVFRYLRRPLFPQIAASVRPGGRVIYETFNVNYLEEVPGFNREFLLDPGELSRYFSGWDILYEDEAGFVSQLAAQKPG